MKNLYKGKFLQLVEKNNWEVVQRTNSGNIVAALAITDSAEIVLVEQYREPLGKYVIEGPAGLSDKPGEALVDAMKRELLEETGYTSRDWSVLYDNAPNSAGMTDEKVTKFLALNCKKVSSGGGTENEDIKVHVVPISNIIQFMDRMNNEGKYFDVKILSGLYLYLYNRGAIDVS